MGQVWVPTVVVVMGLFAGCTGANIEPESVGAPGQLVTDEHGAIEGLVTNDALEPLADVVVILDGDQNTFTTEHGAFSLPLVPPGTHVVAVSKDGYLGAFGAVDVFASEVATLRLVMVTAEAARAYHETKIKAGLIGCGAAVTANGVTPTPSLCGLQDTAGVPIESFNKHVTDLEMGTVTPSWVGFWAETTWTTTQALGSQMTVNWWTANAPIGTPGRVLNDQIPNGTVAGPSPLRTRFTLEEAQGKITSGITGERTICFQTCIVSAGHFAAPENVNGIGAGVTIQQRFDDYVTLFHYGDLPTEFSALPDG